MLLLTMKTWRSRATGSVTSEHRSLDLYLANSEETLLKYVVRTNNLGSEDIEGTEEYKWRLCPCMVSLKETPRM